MELHEKIEEDIIKREKAMRENYVPLSQVQQERNISNNWMEVIDENGNKHYEPKFDDIIYIDASNMQVPKSGLPVSVFVLILVALVILAFIVYFFFI
jgi:hypothetical protein